MLQGQCTGAEDAQQRTGTGVWGRVTSFDPYQLSAGLAAPQSGNQHTPVNNDPLNFHDPSGLAAEARG